MNTTPPPRPLPNSYCATPLLLACEYPSAPTPVLAAPKLDALLAADTRDFYDLTQPGELEPYETQLRERVTRLGVASESSCYRRFPVEDMGLPTAKRLAEVLAALAGSAAASRRAAVHCWGGISRTGTVVGCHLQQACATRRRGGAGPHRRRVANGAEGQPLPHLPPDAAAAGLRAAVRAAGGRQHVAVAVSWLARQARPGVPGCAPDGSLRRRKYLIGG